MKCSCGAFLQKAHNKELASRQEKLEAALADLLSERKGGEEELRKRANKIEVQDWLLHTMPHDWLSHRSQLTRLCACWHMSGSSIALWCCKAGTACLLGAWDHCIARARANRGREEPAEIHNACLLPCWNINSNSILVFQHKNIDHRALPVQELERALQVTNTRGEEALKGKADAEGSLHTLQHRHADMEVPRLCM